MSECVICLGNIKAKKSNRLKCCGAYCHRKCLKIWSLHQGDTDFNLRLYRLCYCPHCRTIIIVFKILGDMLIAKV